MLYHNLDDMSRRKYKLPCGHYVLPPIPRKGISKCPTCGREFTPVVIFEIPRPVEQKRRIPQPQRIQIRRR